MTTLASEIGRAVAERQIYIQWPVGKHLFFFTVDSAPDDSYYIDLSDYISDCYENGSAMTEKASAVALRAQNTTSLGAWFWDSSAERLYIKPKTSLSPPYDEAVTYVAEVTLFFSERELFIDGIQYDPRILPDGLPTISQKNPRTFTGLGQIASGNIQFANSDGFFDDRETYEWDWSTMKIYLRNKIQ